MSTNRARQRESIDDLGPETIVPAQFHAGHRIDASSMPEKRLMLAVLEDALATLRKYAGSRSLYGQRLYREAQRWFASNEASWPFAFVSVCDVLGIDPSRFRSGVARWMRAAKPARGGRAGTRVVPVEAEDDRRSA